jgi:hypothetical protein
VSSLRFQRRFIPVNDGETKGKTVTFNVWLVAQGCKLDLSKTYQLTVLLTIAGDQVPDIPFGEVGPKIGEGEPKQIGAIGLKLGVVVKVPQGTLQVITERSQGYVACATVKVTD